MSTSPQQIALEAWRGGASYVKAAEAGGISVGQITKLVRPSMATIAELRKRSRNRCEKCRSVSRLEVHHRTRSAEDFNGLGNLAYLCVFCHRELETVNVKKGDTCPVTAYVPLDVADWLVDGADREGISLSQHIGRIFAATMSVVERDLKAGQ